jgi:hypothetical protein
MAHSPEGVMGIIAANRRPFGFSAPDASLAFQLAPPVNELLSDCAKLIRVNATRPQPHNQPSPPPLAFFDPHFKLWSKLESQKDEHSRRDSDMSAN